MALEVDSLLKDRFRILRPLGEGGMGEVYLGEDERGGVAEGRPVAIKSLRNDISGSDAQLFLRRFREEIEILRRLRAQGIPAFVDAFEEADRSFLIMEYIEGHSLHSLLDRSPNGLRPSMVAEIGIHICRILQHLHSSVPQLIHRDIKPSNIIIRSSDESVFLVDFGLAREFHGEGAARTLVGTVDYCPIEQLQGYPEPRSDLYALGATMFELLTGQVPKPLNIPSLNAVAPNLPVAISEVVDRAVQSHVDDRYPTAAAMLKALADCRRVLEHVEAPSLSIYDSPDRAEHIIQNWGREDEKASLPSGLKVERLRQEAQRRKPLLLLILLVLVVWAGLHFRSRGQYVSEQNHLVMDALVDGVPGPGWRLETVRGLFPADGLGLGPPDSRFENPSRSGCSFRTMAAMHTVTSMSFRVRRLKSAPRLLVYSHPWGLLMEPKDNRYLARLVKVGPGFTLEDGYIEENSSLPPLPFDLGRSLGVRLSIEGTIGQLTVGRNTRRFRTKEGWNSKVCGVVLLNAVNRTRCLVEDWQVK
ncbi:MAG: serine/threonine protein kinase [Candidatus Eremiobacteraeota bacterium]|nr:serine/threonine protein kinase [Candidatus Eremiobacteraeota bacterium]